MRDDLVTPCPAWPRSSRGSDGSGSGKLVQSRVRDVALVLVELAWTGRGLARLFRGFSPGKTTPRDLGQTTVIAKLLHVSSQPKVTSETITVD